LNTTVLVFVLSIGFKSPTKFLELILDWL